MAAFTSTFPRLHDLSPLALALTVAGTLGLASLLLDRVQAQASDIRARTELQATGSLAEAGYPWARLTIDDDVGRVHGVAPNDAARAQAMQAASRLLAPAMGWPGVFARLEDAQRVAPPLRPAMSPVPTRAVAPASASASAFASTSATATAVPAAAMALPQVARPARDAGAPCATALAATQGEQRIVFDSGAIQPTAASLQLLDRLAPLIQACAGARLAVQGHSDAVGAPVANQRLSLRRAQAVAAALTQRGVPAAQLGAEGLGASQLLDTADSPDAHSRNRRIEFHWAVPAST